MPSVLYVDDEEGIRRAVRAWLSRQEIEVHTARGVRSAKSCMGRFRFDCAFIDIWLADGTGFDLYAWIQSSYPEVAKRTVFVTGDIVASASTRKTLETFGRPVMAKPFDLTEIDRHLQQWDASGKSSSDVR